MTLKSIMSSWDEKVQEVGRRGELLAQNLQPANRELGQNTEQRGSE